MMIWDGNVKIYLSSPFSAVWEARAGGMEWKSIDEGSTDAWG